MSSSAAFPEYYPLHLRPEDAPPRRRGLDIFQQAWKLPFAHIYYPAEASVGQEQIADEQEQDQ